MRPYKLLVGNWWICNKIMLNIYVKCRRYLIVVVVVALTFHICHLVQCSLIKRLVPFIFVVDSLAFSSHLFFFVRQTEFENDFGKLVSTMNHGFKVMQDATNKKKMKNRTIFDRWIIHFESFFIYFICGGLCFSLKKNLKWNKKKNDYKSHRF